MSIPSLHGVVEIPNRIYIVKLEHFGSYSVRSTISLDVRKNVFKHIIVKLEHIVSYSVRFAITVDEQEIFKKS